MRRGGCAVLAALLLVGAWGGWRAFRATRGEPSARLEDRWFEGARVVDRRGRLLKEFPSEKGLRGRDLRLVDVGPRLIAATLVAEDGRFFEHDGVDVRAASRAFFQNLTAGRRVSGASTIPAQLVKLLDHEGQPHERTLALKLSEVARAQNLSAKLDKERVLESYLERLDYGRGLVGAVAAAEGYFGVRPTELSWAQAATLAVLPRAPSWLDPVRHPERVETRVRIVLDALRDGGQLSAEDVERARAERVAARVPPRPFDAPHFVLSLRARGALMRHGVTRTTIDGALQDDVQGLVNAHLRTLEPQRASHAAVVVVDNASGEVLVHVGNRTDVPSTASGRNETSVDMASRRRQPGSALKPFVYALAFARGLRPTDVLGDVPASFGTGSGAYVPTNFDGSYMGPVAAREALAASLNVPAVRLMATLPRGALFDLLSRAGVSLEGDEERYGLSLALGSAEVTPRELAAAYAFLARGGRPVSTDDVLRAPADSRAAVDSEAHAAAAGAADTPADAAADPMLDPAAVALVTDALSDPMLRLRALRGGAARELPYPVAIKTGTSSGYRDGWTAGYTRERTVVVWVGNADQSPMLRVSGASGAGPLFFSVMHRAMRDVGARAALVASDALVPAHVCPISGLRPGSACPKAVVRRFAPGTAPDKGCAMHAWVRGEGIAAAHGRPTCATGLRTPSAAPSSHASFVPTSADAAPSIRGSTRALLLPAEFDTWLARLPPGAPGRDPFGMPWIARSRTDGCDVATGDVGELVLDAPSDGSVYYAPNAGGAHVEARVRTSPSETGAVVELLVDGAILASERVARGVVTLSTLVPAVVGDHVVEVRASGGLALARPARARFSVRGR